MSGWTAIVPFNFGRPRKTRLAARLTVTERDLLAWTMAEHVVAALTAAPSVQAIHLLSPLDPQLPGTVWVRDGGQGLNAELGAARDALDGAPTLLIHADLPLLTGEDVEAMLAAIRTNGAAIAPDRAAMGTNAIALGDGCTVPLAFGVDSLARHRAILPDAPLIERAGLALDVDDGESLDAAIAAGFVVPVG